MKFNIISINDNRIKYKNAIRKNCLIEEVRIPSTNAYNSNIAKEFDLRQLFLSRNWIPKIGEAGCWLSHFDCWEWASENETLVVFEDDAVVPVNFALHLKEYMQQLPSDWDFLSLWVPDNQQMDYYYQVTYDDDGIPEITGRVSGEDSYFNYGARGLAKAYQGYGLVGTVYSPQGGRKLIESVRNRGILTPVDCFIFQEAHAGRVNGFAPKPYRNLVNYDWQADTTIHNTEKFNAI